MNWVQEKKDAFGCMVDCGCYYMCNQDEASLLLDLDNKQVYLDDGMLSFNDLDKVEHDTMRNMRLVRADLRKQEEEKKEMMAKLAKQVGGNR